MADLPLKREDDFVIVELPEETLVYDRQHTRAHCLNRTAAAVWRACDGRTTSTRSRRGRRARWMPM